MAPLWYRRHRFPPEIIQHAIWLYLRFTLSYRDVEELLANRGLDISYETGGVASTNLARAYARERRRNRVSAFSKSDLPSTTIDVGNRCRGLLSSSPIWNWSGSTITQKPGICGEVTRCHPSTFS